MAEPQDPTDPPDPPPLAHRADDDSGYDSRFDSAEDDRRADEAAKRRRRTILVIVLVSTLTPFAVCGLLFAVCAFM